MRDTFIEDPRATWPIAIPCRVLAVSRRGYDEWRRRPVSDRAKRRASLTAQIREFHVGHHASDGSPRVPRKLRARGEAVHEKTVAHSDRGVPYASEHDQGVLTPHDLECRLSRQGHCWDNAPAESFFATLKKEWGPHEVYETRQAARASLFDDSDVFYNRERRPSAVGDVSPLTLEQEAA